MLDLIWHNLASEAQSTFHGAHVNWTGLLRSDHALLCTYAVPQARLIRQCKDHTNQFDTNINTEAWEEWHAILDIELPSSHYHAQTVADINRTVDAIYVAYNNACAATMKWKGTAPGFNTCWWTDKCKTATYVLQDTFEPDDICHLNHELKRVTCCAKRDWANEYITAANVWEVTAWCHG
jgi:hypothetical protein